ncbi:MAG TPA: hypothetical protein VGR42_03810 [Casimicrobiaceae bacterium]|nr:hypothetical protein [Casimicrobiaceae bacterium]
MAVGHAVDVLGPREVFEREFATFLDLELDGKEIAHNLESGGGQQRLAALGMGEQARDAIECRAEVVVVTLFGETRVQRAAHAQSAGCVPILRGYCALDRRRRADRAERRVERSAEAIADGLEHLPAVALNRRAQQSIVADQYLRHRVTVRFPQTRAAFDVGEQKRDVAGRKRHRFLLGASPDCRQLRIYLNSSPARAS